MGAPVDTAPRKGGASSERSSPWRADRSQSPGLRNRTTSVSPLLGESSTSQRTYNPALIFALTYCVGYPVLIQVRQFRIPFLSACAARRGMESRF